MVSPQQSTMPEARRPDCLTWIEPRTRVRRATAEKVHRSRWFVVTRHAGKETVSRAQVDTGPRMEIKRVTL